MSAYKKIKCNIVDKDTLIKALKTIGFDPLIHETPQNLRGYRNDIRKDLAEIVVPKEQINSLFTGASNDLGFLWNEEETKYEIICSEYDSKFNIDQRIVQAYTKIVIEEALEKQGYKIKVNIADEDLQKKKTNANRYCCQENNLMSKEIELNIEIDEKGNVKVTPKGTVGKECLDILKFLDKLEGVEVKETVANEDMNKTKISNLNIQGVKMNNLEKWFWSLLSTKGSEFSSLAVKHPGPVSVQAAEDADTEEVLSVRENGSNAGKYVAEYLKAVGLGVGNPWCMAFVVFRVIKAAHKLIVNIPAHMPRTGSVAVYGKWAQSQGHFIKRADLELGKSVPMKGDIVVYWFASKGRLAHAGIVVEGGKNFYTVEGNTSSGIETGVDRDGQGTYKKLRKYSHLGIFGGIIRLPY